MQMRTLLVSLILAAPVCGLGTTAPGPDRCSEIDKTRIPGTYLKWIEVAEPVFQQKRLNLDRYNIVIYDKSETVVVSLRATDATCEGKGSTGSIPDFEVEIRKSDRKIVHSNFVK
jgi:hypothetical protein